MGVWGESLKNMSGVFGNASEIRMNAAQTEKGGVDSLMNAFNLLSEQDKARKEREQRDVMQKTEFSFRGDEGGKQRAHELELEKLRGRNDLAVANARFGADRDQQKEDLFSFDKVRGIAGSIRAAVSDVYAPDISIIKEAAASGDPTASAKLKSIMAKRRQDIEGRLTKEVSSIATEALRNGLITQDEVEAFKKEALEIGLGIALIEPPGGEEDVKKTAEASSRYVKPRDEASTSGTARSVFGSIGPDGKTFVPDFDATTVWGKYSIVPKGADKYSWQGAEHEQTKATGEAIATVESVAKILGIKPEPVMYKLYSSGRDAAIQTGVLISPSVIEKELDPLIKPAQLGGSLSKDQAVIEALRRFEEAKKRIAIPIPTRIEEKKSYYKDLGEYYAAIRALAVIVSEKAGK